MIWMEAKARLNRAQISTTAFVTLAVAIFLAFLVGGGTGYLVRATTVPIAMSNSPAESGKAKAVCPSGTHVVVWYTAKISSCVQD